MKKKFHKIFLFLLLRVFRKFSRLKIRMIKKTTLA
jgi:hypothetical protein